MKIYKIKNRTTNLFWQGHSHANFSKSGKAWHQRNHVSSAITNSKIKGKIPKFLEDCDLVEYEIVEKSIIPIIQLYE